jgi:cytochrome o ubiquinol oxidase subunit 2
MNSFFIPALGGQIYAMAGMQTQLHLIANENGVFDGISANYSGAGFTGMKFKAEATSQADFDAWVSKVKATPNQLDTAEYAEMAKPSENNPAVEYSSFAPNLFQTILDKYEGMNPGKGLHSEHEAGGSMEGMDMGANSAAGAKE